MRKDALAITVASLVMGAFGAFLRWLQNRLIYEEETGLAIPGAAVSVIYTVFSLLMVCGMLGIVLVYVRRREKPRDGEAAFRVSTVFPAVLAWACCAVYALAGVRLMFSAGAAVYPLMQRLLGGTAVIAGVLLPVLPCRRSDESAGTLGRRAASAALALFFCYWLVFSYRSNAQNPVLWVYVPEILALAALTMVFYYAAAWFYGRPRPNAAVFCMQLAVFLSFCTLPDARSGAMAALIAASAAMTLLLEYIVLANMGPAEEQERGPEGKRK